ncbi:MAG: metalloregulator ArsR/SmtB family transcription factor [Hyphomicrobiaceae bacterium]|nr:MAG: metalloregulator ArsR/SmtB family transcription factor [Hyphomicrobiaceae bacterium]
MKNIPAKKRVFACLARMGKALASGNRLELLEALGQSERSVEELAGLAGLSVANTSHHLQVLREGGLVKSRRQGVHIFYSLSDDQVAVVLAGLGHVAERHLDEMDRIIREEFKSRDELEPVSQKDLLRMARSGEVTVIDVRPAEEYEAGHIPGAINLPVGDLQRHLGKLPRNREIVAYCRGAYCVLAFDAVRQLRARGFRARRLADGLPEWKAGGRPVATGRS